MADYHLGAAGLYLLVDLPGSGRVTEATFEAHDFAAGTVTTEVGVIELVVGGQRVRLDLTGLAEATR